MKRDAKLKLLDAVNRQLTIPHKLIHSGDISTIVIQAKDLITFKGDRIIDWQDMRHLVNTANFLYVEFTGPKVVFFYATNDDDEEVL